MMTNWGNIINTVRPVCVELSEVRVLVLVRRILTTVFLRFVAARLSLLILAWEVSSYLQKEDQA